jgi:hypothetical protein
MSKQQMIDLAVQNMPKESYNPEIVAEKYMQNVNDGFEYICKYFFKVLTPVCVLFWSQSKFIIMKPEDVISIIPDISNSFIGEDGKEYKRCLRGRWINYLIYYNQVFDVEKPLIFHNEAKHEHYINMFIGSPHNLNKKFSEMSDTVQENIKIIWKHIREVYCNDDEKQYQYVHDWICNAVCFKRNKTSLYLNSIQGTGKSTITTFLINKVFGNNISVMLEDVNCLTSAFNGELMGMVFIVFEEFPCSSPNEWHMFSKKLKTLITEDTITIKKKYLDNFPYPNPLNVMAHTNEYNAIKTEQSERRHNMLDVSTKYVGNMQYFDKLYDAINAKHSGLAFYRYCHEYQNLKFDPRVLINSNTKSDNSCDNLDPLFKFIKEYYIRDKKDLICKFSEFYNLYQLNCKNAKSKIHVSKLLKDYKIPLDKKDNNQLYLNMIYSDLREFYDKKKWIHETDEIDFNNNDNTDDLEANVEPIQKIIAPKYEDMNSIELHELIEKLQQIEENKIRQQFNITEEKVKEQPKEPKVIVDFNNTNGIVIQELKKKNENEAEVKHISVF